MIENPSGITPEQAEQARDVRARALKFVLNCHAKKKAAEGTHPDGRDDKKGRSQDDFLADTTSLPR